MRELLDESLDESQTSRREDTDIREFLRRDVGLNETPTSTIHVGGMEVAADFSDRELVLLEEAHDRFIELRKAAWNKSFALTLGALNRLHVPWGVPLRNRAPCIRECERLHYFLDALLTEGEYSYLLIDPQLIKKAINARASLHFFTKIFEKDLISISEEHPEILSVLVNYPSGLLYIIENFKDTGVSLREDKNGIMRFRVVNPVALKMARRFYSSLAYFRPEHLEGYLSYETWYLSKESEFKQKAIPKYIKQEVRDKIVYSVASFSFRNIFEKEVSRYEKDYPFISALIKAEPEFCIKWVFEDYIETAAYDVVCGKDLENSKAFKEALRLFSVYLKNHPEHIETDF